MVSPFVLSVLKYAFLALLYFFVYRAIRAVFIDMRGNKGRNGRKQGTNGTAVAASPGGGSKPAKTPRIKPQRTGKAKPPVIVIIRDAKGKKLESKKLTGTLQIGRDEKCELRPDDPYLSQFHAKLYANNDVWYVEDLGSTNGTYLNQQRLTGPIEIHANDTIRAGETTLELRR
jgi:pSer/pThr/pTyr-binding forkhead associated (FHA) protein